jgi:hypothetical protein
VPLFGKANKAPEPETPRSVGEVKGEEFALKLSYVAKSSESVRLQNTPGVPARLARMLQGCSQGEPELIEPYPVELNAASPFITKMPGAPEWLTYHRKRSPIARHALVVLEGTDAIDLAFDTLVCGLLEGETDTSGYPDFGAIVGGVASHWDEMSGDLIARAVVGYGGKGVRGDTDRNASRAMAAVFNNILADEYAMGVVTVERPTLASKQGGPACTHCGFNSGHERAFYCPKCGMRMHG